VVLQNPENNFLQTIASNLAGNLCQGSVPVRGIVAATPRLTRMRVPRENGCRVPPVPCCQVHGDPLQFVSGHPLHLLSAGEADALLRPAKSKDLLLLFRPFPIHKSPVPHPSERSAAESKNLLFEIFCEMGGIPQHSIGMFCIRARLQPCRECIKINVGLSPGGSLASPYSLVPIP